MSGALRVIDPPVGTVYLLDGGVEYAGCSIAAGVERLLTASGRLPAEVWRMAVNTGRAQNRVGAQLLGTGLISSAELESVVLLALYDAAHFLFDLEATTRFEPGVPRMVRAGLVEPGRPGGSAAAGSVAMVRANTGRPNTIAREKPPRRGGAGAEGRPEPVQLKEETKPAAIPLPRRPVSSVDRPKPLVDRDPRTPRRHPRATDCGAWLMVMTEAPAGLLDEIRGLRGRLTQITGVVVATVDGLLVAHDSKSGEAESQTLAAMSAAQLGLASRWPHCARRVSSETR